MGLIYLCQFRNNTILCNHNDREPIAFDCETRALVFWSDAYSTFAEPEFDGRLTGQGTSLKVKVYGVVVGTITVVEFRESPA